MANSLSRTREWLAQQVQRVRVRRQFERHMGIDGDFENPRSHQEKTQFRKIYGNHEFYARVSDKYRVREYVAAKGCERHLIPLLGVYDRLTPAVFDSLPERFIIKANHGCKWHQVVTDKNRLDINKTMERFNRYLRMRYGWQSAERHYGFIQPKIVIEELLQSEHGGLPWDYCFFSYNSPAGFDHAYSITCPRGRSAAFTKDGELLVSNIPEDELSPRLNPSTHAQMVQVARQLSADFDFVRVDLYSIRDRVYFGELTCTPGQGYAKADARRQKLRDEMWHLDARNPLLYRAPAAYGRNSRSSVRPITVYPARVP